MFPIMLGQNVKIIGLVKLKKKKEIMEKKITS